MKPSPAPRPSRASPPARVRHNSHRTTARTSHAHAPPSASPLERTQPHARDAHAQTCTDSPAHCVRSHQQLPSIPSHDFARALSYARALLPTCVRARVTVVLPHPRLQDRAFVLVPLADVARDWVHPVLGQSVAEMLAACPPEEVAEVTPL